MQTTPRRSAILPAAVASSVRVVGFDKSGAAVFYDLQARPGPRACPGRDCLPPA